MAYNELKFDVEKIKTMRDSIKNNRDLLVSSKDEAKRQIDELRDEWKTPAGDKYRDQLNDEWANDVQKYVEIMDAVVEILNETIIKYSEVERKVKKISLY